MSKIYIEHVWVMIEWKGRSPKEESQKFLAQKIRYEHEHHPIVDDDGELRCKQSTGKVETSNQHDDTRFKSFNVEQSQVS
jgi:hypothetical protein